MYVIVSCFNAQTTILLPWKIFSRWLYRPSSRSIASAPLIEADD